MSRVLVLLLSLFWVTACASTDYGRVVIYGPPGDPSNPPQGVFQPNAYLRVCPGMTVTNAPPHDADLWIREFNPVIVVGEVVLATVPVNDVCLSSGFGFRNTRTHEGIDLSSRPPGVIYTAAPGLVLEARESSGYGLQVLLDHGKGVYTRYAHLAYLDPSISVGQEFGFGQPIGMMGNTGNATATHLHFEILTGNYRNPRGSKGLTPQNPFLFPAYAPVAAAGY